MSSQLTANIRLVKCPRCRRVLPELSNVPVYQCGGCHAFLQVKKRKNGINDTGLHIYEADITQKKDSEDTKTQNETNGGKHSVDKIIETGPKENELIFGFSSGRESFEAAMEEAEDDLDRSLLKHTINLNDQDGKGSKGLGSPDEVNSLTDSDHCKSQINNHQSEVFLPVDESHDEVSGKDDNLEKNNENNRVSPSNDLTCHEVDSPQTETRSEFNEDAISRYIFGNFKKEKHLTSQSLSRESTSTENISPSHIEVTEVEPITSKETLENTNLAVNQNLCNQILPPNELSCEELKDSSPVIGTQNESKENFLSRPVFGSLKKENCLLEENPAPPHNEQVEQPQSRKSSRCNSISSEETLENIAFTNVDSMHRSNHAYDGSESSLEKTDEHYHDQYLRLLKGKCTESLPTSSYLDSFSIEKKACATEGFTHRQDQPVRRWTQFQSDKRFSKDHFRPRASHEYGTSSKYVGNQLQFGRNGDFPPKFEDPEEEKLKLKKMVLELQDQLNRSRTPKGYASCGLNHNGYPNRFHLMGHSCLQYSPHDWHCSAPFSPHVYTKPNQYAGYTDHNHYNIQCPCSESPIKSCEMMHSNERGKRHAPKRHVLPVKSGAPFVICDNCSKLLQLPADFLLFKKRFHQLRCGSCSYVFKFWLRNGYILDRYTDRYGESGDLAPAPPPPSEVDDMRDMYKGAKISNGGNCPHADSLWISEDYGPSICKSCSTEGEHLSYDVQKRDLNGKNTISGGSIDHLNWRKNQSQQSVLKESQNIHNHRISKAEKPSPVIEKLRGRDVSPLHRLMGYNSAREVLNS